MKSIFLRTISFSIAFLSFSPIFAAETDDELLDDLLKRYGFTGQIEAQLPKKLGRPLDAQKIELGRLVFFDKGLGIHKTNSCSGCHSPTAGFGDTQPIAIGVGAKLDTATGTEIVGRDRAGTRNQRRTPMVLNIGFYPALMWNGRFASNSGDPFDNSRGFVFPLPEARAFFPANDPRFPHLLGPQAHIPFTEQPEMAGFGGLSRPNTSPVVLSRFNSQFLGAGPTGFGQLKKQRARPMAGAAAAPDEGTEIDESTAFRAFDDVGADMSRFLPEPFADGASRNNPIRHKVTDIINRINEVKESTQAEPGQGEPLVKHGRQEYRERFGQIFPSVQEGGIIEFWMIGQVLAEFQLSLTFADAPIDRFARGDKSALKPNEKKGAITFFGKANCVGCHAVSGQSNEMFSDFRSHNAGVPPVAPDFGPGKGNVPFRNLDGKGMTKGRFDFGLADITALESDRFRFRTSPLRNVSLQPFFFHNGAFNNLGNAIKYHLDPIAGSKTYNPANEGVPKDLFLGEFAPVFDHLSPQFRGMPKLSATEVADLVAFVSTGMLDHRLSDKQAVKERFVPMTPDPRTTVMPSGQKPHLFQFE